MMRSEYAALPTAQPDAEDPELKPLVEGDVPMLPGQYNSTITVSKRMIIVFYILCALLIVSSIADAVTTFKMSQKLHGTTDINRLPRPDIFVGLPPMPSENKMGKSHHHAHHHSHNHTSSKMGEGDGKKGHGHHHTHHAGSKMMAEGEKGKGHGHHHTHAHAGN